MSSRNAKKLPEQVKFERTFTYDDCIVIWKYDILKTKSGPYEVEIKYPKKTTK
jgi:hypothetical protein